MPAFRSGKRCVRILKKCKASVSRGCLCLFRFGFSCIRKGYTTKCQDKIEGAIGSNAWEKGNCPIFENIKCSIVKVQVSVRTIFVLVRFPPNISCIAFATSMMPAPQRLSSLASQSGERSRILLSYRKRILFPGCVGEVGEGRSRAAALRRPRAKARCALTTIACCQNIFRFIGIRDAARASAKTLRSAKHFMGMRVGGLRFC